MPSQVLTGTGSAGMAAGSLFFKAIPWIVGLVFCAGIGLGLYLRSRHPEPYEILGRIVLEDAGKRTDEGQQEASVSA
ncbi:hypothetical protein AB0I54_28615 [Streptomyces sp. NPDC050625]|uniref:hypothetical protein n=1 Tax=Streptomyces sp. NPDC050625 TaxID=3154629 RepID=UPI003416C330